MMGRRGDTRPSRGAARHPTPPFHTMQAKAKQMGYVQIKARNVVDEERISGKWALQEAQVCVEVEVGWCDCASSAAST